VKHVVKDGCSKVLLKEDGKTVDVTFLDAIGIVLCIIQNKELSGVDGYLATANCIPFFASQNRLDGETADVVIAVNFRAVGVEDEVMPAEPAEVGLFVKFGGGMVPGTFLSMRMGRFGIMTAYSTTFNITSLFR
jgi:hypothetical protein